VRALRRQWGAAADAQKERGKLISKARHFIEKKEDENVFEIVCVQGKDALAVVFLDKKREETTRSEALVLGEEESLSTAKEMLAGKRLRENKSTIIYVQEGKKEIGKNALNTSPYGIRNHVLRVYEKNEGGSSNGVADHSRRRGRKGRERRG